MRSTPGDLHWVGCLLLWSLHWPPPSTPPVEAAVPSIYFQLLRALHVASYHPSSARIKLFPVEVAKCFWNSQATDKCQPSQFSHETWCCNTSVLSSSRNMASRPSLALGYVYQRSPSVNLNFLFQGQFRQGECHLRRHVSWLYSFIIGLTCFPETTLICGKCNETDHIYTYIYICMCVCICI